MEARSRARFWAYVMAFGALWGSAEMTLGAFLHTLRVPFTGVLMAGLGGALLVAQRQVLPIRGASLATAVVAAMCKSLSPGGIILGPMIGITLEGLVVEVALLVAPRALLSALLAGALVTLLAVTQKLVTQVVLYGASILDVYLGLLEKAGDWLGISAAAGWWAVGALAAIVGGIGLLLAGLGRSAGRRAARRLAEEVGP